MPLACRSRPCLHVLQPLSGLQTPNAPTRGPEHVHILAGGAVPQTQGSVVTARPVLQQRASLPQTPPASALVPCLSRPCVARQPGGPWCCLLLSPLQSCAPDASVSCAPVSCSPAERPVSGPGALRLAVACRSRPRCRRRVQMRGTENQQRLHVTHRRTREYSCRRRVQMARRACSASGGVSAAVSR